MRRFFLILGAALAALIIALAALPWWWGAALSVAGPRWGVKFGEYQRIGYWRWAVTDVSWTGSPGQFTARRIELPHPLRWAVQGSDASHLVMTDWKWSGAEEIEKTEVDSTQDSGWQKTFEMISGLMPELQQWVPDLEATRGGLNFGKQNVLVPQLTWNPETAQLTWSELHAVGLAWSGQARWDSEKKQLTGRVASSEGATQFSATAEKVSVNGTWWEQPLVATATFGATGWLPKTADATAADWTLPGQHVGLAGRYETVYGTAQAHWDQDRFELTVNAEGEPAKDQKLPRLEVSAKAHGGLKGFVLDTLKATAPGLQANLSEPVAFGNETWEGSWNTPATLTFDADLATLTRDRASGKVTGKIDVTPTQSKWPQLAARLKADAMRWEDWPEVSGQAEATFDGTVLEVAGLKIKAKDQTHLEVKGAWNVDTQTARDVVIKGEVAQRWVARWLPDDLEFSMIGVDATAAGTWPQMLHQGSLKVDQLTIGAMNPSQWKLDWKGEGPRVDGVLQGEAGKSQLKLVATYADAGLEVTALDLQRADGAKLSLAQPVSLAWRPAWNVSPIDLEGPDDALKISQDQTGTWHLEAAKLERAWLEDWITMRGPDWFIERLVVDGAERKGVWQGRVVSTGAMSMGEDRSAQIALTMNLDADGVQIEEGNISEGELPILNVTGRFPLRVTPSNADQKWNFDASAPMEAEITSAQNPKFWEQIKAATGVEIVDPKITANVQGSWAKPSGEITIGVGLIRFDPERHEAPWLELSDLNAHFTGGSSGLILDDLTAKLSGQTVRARGLLPFDRENLSLLRKDPWKFLVQAGEGRLEIPDADLAAWASLAPEVLSPTGRLQLSVQLSPGGKVDGTLNLQGAATKPIGPLGALQDLQAQVRFDGRRMVIESVQAQTGGRPVELKGEASWSDEGHPKYDMTLVGQNIPFVRQTGLLLRGDVDLKLKTDGDGVTWVRGKVGLRDGLFLVDLLSLRPSQGGSAAGRPPYFSVTAMPFADWRLDLEVKGDNFLRMETPVFSGRASANFRLSGSLSEPRALGEATVTEGVVKLPFASFIVGEGWVRLQQNDPYVPHISVIGTARRFDYGLRMELTGTATSPSLQFFSNPPLTSEEVFLLVMAGESPNSNINYSSSQRAAKLGAYLGQNLISQFTGHSDSEDRLRVSLGEKISQGGKETYRIEYFLNGRWSLVGEYDEFDDYNAGIKWKVFSSKKKEADDEK